MFVTLHLGTMIDIDSRGPIELVYSIQYCIWGLHIGANNLYGLAISLAYPNEEEGGLLIVRMIYTCLRGAIEEEGMRCRVESAPLCFAPDHFQIYIV
jgi:hypothetical protein